MKFAVCDGDRAVLERLSTYIWAGCQCDSLLPIDDFTTLPTIEQFQPDILIISVSMYEQYRTLIQRDALILQRRKLIFICGDDLESDIRVAMYAGAVDFLTSPINDDDLKRVLERAEKLVNLEAADSEPQPEETTNSYKYVTRDMVLCGLLDGRDVPENLKGSIDCMRTTGQSYFIAIAVSVFPYSGEERRSYDYEEVNRLSLYQDKIKNCIEEAVGKYMPILTCAKEDNILAGVFVTEYADDSTRDFLENLFNELQKDIRSRYGCDISAGIGIATPYINLLSLSYQQACDAMRQCSFFKRNSVYFYSDNYFRDPKNAFFTEDETKQIIRLICQCDVDKVRNIVSSAFVRIRKNIVATQSNIMTLKIELIAFINDVTNQIPLSNVRAGIDRKFILEFLRTNDLDLIEELIDKKLEENILALSRDRVAGKAMIIDNVKRMIRDNVRENSSVKTIAYELGITPNYLSSIFHDSTGMCLSEYISGERMKKAAEMLLNTSIRIVDIAAAVGCSSQNYFSKLFKDYYGVSPNDYRKLK